uniref:Peptidase S1 domain-containing protein n=1 Tax=Steinernema glaseri TaxID=37863 RepID=A0A1I8AI28_9BILA
MSSLLLTLFLCGIAAASAGRRRPYVPEAPEEVLEDPNDYSDVEYPHPYPYFVSLQNKTGEYLCGGSIIGDYWILTAAQCLFTEQEMMLPKGQMVATVGHGTSSRKAYKIQGFAMMRSFVKTGGRDDIALIETVEKIQLDKRVKPLCLSSEKVAMGQEVSSVRSETYHCRTDSGGPLVSRGRQVGIVIHKHDSKKRCEVDQNGLFIRIHAYCQSIENATHGQVKCSRNYRIVLHCVLTWSTQNLGSGPEGSTALVTVKRVANGPAEKKAKSYGR